MVKRLMAASMAGTLAVTMFAGCGGSSDSKDSSAKTEDTSEDNSDKPDTWIADRTITVQAYVDDIGNTLPKDFNNTETMKKITELTGIKLDVKYTPGDSDAKVMASQLASGTIPDVIVSYLDNSTRPEFPLLYKAAKDGMFADVSEYMKNSEVYSKYYEDDYLPDDTKNNIVFRDDLDGVYLWQMSIDEIDRSLEYNADEEYVGGMYIQKAIADDLGIDTTAINTQEDFYDLLVKIKEGGYTDDNGNAVYPLGPKYWGGSVDALKYIATGYDWGVSDDYNLDENGDVKHIAETDHVYDEINFVRKLLDEDLMNPEFFTMDSTRAEEVSKKVDGFVEVLSRKEIIQKSLDNYGYILVADTMDEAIATVNEIASEHMEIVTADPFHVMTKIRNAGAIFIGEYSSEPLGDYFAGPNHVLPTNGTAKFFSALSVDDFIKKSSIISYSREALEKVHTDIEQFAECEKLTAHANSIRVRFE